MVSLVSHCVNNAGRGIARRKNFEWFALCHMETSLTRAQWWPGHLAWQGAPGTWKQWLALGASIAFQIATIAGALLAVNDGDRRRQRYRELHQQLGEWDAELEASRTWPSGLRVAGRIERALLAELIEWRSLIRNQKLAKK
jgi:hypothetical protein